MIEHPPGKDYRIGERDYAESVRIVLEDGKDAAYEYLSTRLGEALDALEREIGIKEEDYAQSESS